MIITRVIIRIDGIIGKSNRKFFLIRKKMLKLYYDRVDNKNK